MSRETIRDKNLRTIGYIETQSDGKQKALDANLRTLGHYDPRSNETRDANLRMIAKGNVLAGLIYK